MLKYGEVYNLESLSGYILWFWRPGFSGESLFTEMCEVLSRSKDRVCFQLLY